MPPPAPVSAGAKTSHVSTKNEIAKFAKLRSTHENLIQEQTKTAFTVETQRSLRTTEAEGNEVRGHPDKEVGRLPSRAAVQGRIASQELNRAISSLAAMALGDQTFVLVARQKKKKAEHSHARPFSAGKELLATKLD